MNALLLLAALAAGSPQAAPGAVADKASVDLAPDDAHDGETVPAAAVPASPPLAGQPSDTPATPGPEREQRARALYAAGSAAYVKGRYTVAIDAFEEALRLVEATPVFCSCAQARSLNYFIDSDPHHLERTVALYRLYMAVAPEGTRRDHAGQHLAVLGPLLEQTRLAELTADPPPPPPARLIVTANAADATIALDDGDPQASPATFTTRPGAHTVRVQAEGYLTQLAQAVAVDGATIAAPVELMPTPATLDVRAPSGADVFIDGVRSSVGAVLVAPGRHRVTVLAHGHDPFSAEANLAAGETASIDAALDLTAQSWIGYSALAGAGALLSVTVVPGVAFGAALLALSSMPLELQHRALTVDEARLYTTVEASLGWLGVATGVLFTAAAATALTGGALLFLDEPEEPSAATFPEQAATAPAPF